MALHYNGTLQFADFGGKKCQMKFSGVDDVVTLETLANAMSGRSCAKVVGLTVSEQNDDPQGMGTPINGKWDAIDQKAEIFVEDTATGRVSRFELPAPLETTMEHAEGVGYIYKKAQGDAFASDVSTATGRTFRFVKGRLIGRATQAQV